jgi:PAS domain S-box-containing protein
MKEKKKKNLSLSHSRPILIVHKNPEQYVSFVPSWLKDFAIPSEEAIFVFDKTKSVYLLSEESVSWLNDLYYDETGTIRFDINSSLWNDITMLMEQARKGKKPVTRYITFEDASGRKLVATTRMFPVFEGGSFSGAICFMKNGKTIKEKETHDEAKEKKLLEAQRIAHMGDWENDVKANRVIWSEETYHIFGYLPGEKSPQDIFNDHLHPDDRENYWKNIKERLASGQKKIPDYEFRIINKQGEIRYCIARGEFQYDENGKPYYAFGTIQDITESTLLKKSLAENEKKLRAIVETSQVGIILVNQNGIITFSNDAMAEMLHMTISELVGTAYMDHLHPSESDQGKELMNKLIRGETDRVLTERHYIRKDGSDFWGLLSGKRLTDDQGNLTSLVGVIMDISEQKAILQALQKSEEKFRSVFDMSLNLICIIDLNHLTLLHTNPAFNEMAGKAREPEGEDSILNFLHPDDKKKMIELFDKVLRKGNCVYHLENRFLAKDDQFHILDWNIKPDLLSGLAYAIANDITELKSYQNSLIEAKEQAEENDRLKSAFLANMSHEIRTPLNGIIGFSELLCHPGIDEATRTEYVEILNTCSQQLISIIENILDISKIETGQVKIKKTQVNINELLKDLYTSYEKYFEKNGIDLRLSLYQSDPDCFIYSDETKIRKIITHLLENALKFTPKGYVTFGWTLQKHCIEFFVQDTGVGIPENSKQQIFEKFYQADAGITRTYSGLGLGLSISKSYAGMLGGKIRHEPYAKGGTVFLLSLPIEDVTINKRFTAQNTVTELYRNSRKELNVLIVEDEEANLRFLEEVFKQINHSVLKAFNGLEAVEMCKKDARIDLVLMDLKMPVMDGFEATSQIKKMRPGLPVIAQTAFSDQNIRENLNSAGFDGYLEKPIRIQALFDLIKRYSG